MSQKHTLRLLVCPLALFAAGGLAVGCGDDPLGGDEDCDTIGLRVDALNTSVAKLEALADGIRLEVGTACATIAGEAMPTNPSDSDVETLCDAATVAINANLTGSVEIVIIPPACSVNAQAQLNCEASCYAEAEVECDPGTIEARCDPGELSVQCEGSCEVGAKCEGSLDVAVACEGSCEGKCEGTCDGTCSVMNTEGECEGECTGTCTGECRGSCEVTAEGGVECTGEARCKGGCTGTATAPKCEATIDPPSCEASANVDCSADCQGSASLDAECTPAGVEITGDVDATFAANLEASLPVLLAVAEKGTLGLSAAGSIVTDMGGLVGDVASCTLSVGASAASAFAASAEAAVTASASVSVSFQASASVSGSAAGSAG